MYAVVSVRHHRNTLVRYWFFSLGLYSSLGFYTTFWTKSLGGRLIVKSAYTQKYTVFFGASTEHISATKILLSSSFLIIQHSEPCINTGITIDSYTCNLIFSSDYNSSGCLPAWWIQPILSQSNSLLDFCSTSSVLCNLSSAIYKLPDLLRLIAIHHYLLILLLLADCHHLGFATIDD